APAANRRSSSANVIALSTKILFSREGGSRSGSCGCGGQAIDVIVAELVTELGCAEGVEVVAAGDQQRIGDLLELRFTADRIDHMRPRSASRSALRAASCSASGPTHILTATPERLRAAPISRAQAGPPTISISRLPIPATSGPLSRRLPQHHDLV